VIRVGEDKPQRSVKGAMPDVDASITNLQESQGSARTDSTGNAEGATAAVVFSAGGY